MERTLVAERPLFYRKRALVAGQTFVASHVDADYMVRKGDASLLAVTTAVEPPVFLPPAAAVAVDVVATPAAEAAAAVADPLTDPHEGLTFHALPDDIAVADQAADAPAPDAVAAPDAGDAPAEPAAEPAAEAAAEAVAEATPAAAEQPEADTTPITSTRRGGQTRRRHNSSAE